MADYTTFRKGRGAQFNPSNRFNTFHQDEQLVLESKTRFIPTKAKTIVNKVESPDIPMPFSMNPYQGCEHGCVYCYARNTHPYWGYSAGLDFEQKILVKKDAPALLQKYLGRKNYLPQPILLSGNTDCYQPAEQEFRLTRQILEICLQYRQPVSIITKNSLILRDLDILKPMAGMGLVQVILSITTLDESLRSLLEPRTAASLKRLKTVEELSRNDIPVFVMMAPVIPGLTDQEIYDLAEQVAGHGGWDFFYSLLRLNGDVEPIFKDWLEKTFPDRVEKILNRTADCHGGSVQDSRFRVRMKGEGHFAAMIREQVRLAKSRLGFPKRNAGLLNCNRFKVPKPQLELFD